MRYRMYASRVCVVSARAVAFHLAVWAGHALSALRVRDPVARRTETFRFSALPSGKSFCETRKNHESNDTVRHVVLHARTRTTTATPPHTLT